MDLMPDTGVPLNQRLFFLALHEMDHPVLILDQNRTILYVNLAFSDLFQYTLEEVAGRTPEEVLTRRRAEAAALQHLRFEDESSRDAILLYSKDGREIWASEHVTPLSGESGAVGNFVVVLVNRTEAHQLRDLQHVVLEAITSGLPLEDVADRICREVEGIAPEVRSSMLAVDEEGRLHPLAGPNLSTDYLKALEGQKIGASAGSCGTAAYLGRSVGVTDIETDPLWENYKSIVLPMDIRACWSAPIQRLDGRVVGTLALYYREKRAPSAFHKKIVSACVHLCMLAIERENAKRKIKELSHFDSLTGLPNRASFYEMAAELTAKTDGEQITFFAIDLNRLDDINNTLGYIVGDRVLVEVAYRLQKLAQPRGIVSRVEGDSFLLALPGASVAKAVATAADILEVIKAPLRLREGVLSIAAHIGISITEAGNSDPQISIEQAITASLQKGASEQEAYHFYRPEMNQIAQDRLILGAALGTAIRKGALSLDYQPQVRLATGELTGVEALMRWHDERLGEVPPKKFIPLADELGFSEEFGRWALQEACRQMAQWRERGVPVPVVSVNLSPLHFRSQSLPRFVADLLRQYNLPARCLTIEITESDMMARNPQSLESIKALHEMGLWMSVDDFGTGFSSLARLTRFPINELKLDRSFISDLEREESARALTTAVIRIGQSLKMSVVSEGVETVEQAQLLLDLGCDVAQGFLYAQPMTAPDLERWIVSRKPVVLNGSIAP